MNDLTPIQALVSRARRRLLLADVVNNLARGALPVGIALCGIVSGAKLGAPWLNTPRDGGVWFLIATGCALISLAAFTYFARRGDGGDVAVASILDVRLKLHDRLSTAIALADRTDAFARAAIEDGLRVAGDRRFGEALPRALPIESPKRWWIGPLLAVTAAAVWWFVPALSLANIAQADSVAESELQAAREAAKVQVESIQVALAENPELSKAVAGTQDDKPLAADLSDEQLNSPEEVRRETTRQVNELSKRLDQLLAGEQAQQLEAMKEALSRIEPSQSGPLQKLAEALKRGDAAAAKAELSNLQKRLDEEPMDQKSREELAAKLTDLAQQLKDAAQARDALKQALESAGLDGALAKNPEAAKAAVEGAKHLNQAQKDALKQAIAAESKAGEKLEKIAKACESMCSQCKNGGSKSGGKGGKSGQSGSSASSPSGSEGAAAMASESLSEMEMLNELMKDAESARSQCSKSCSGGGSSSDSAGQSSMGANRARGFGGERTKEATATGTKARKEKVESLGGDVIARQLVDAPPVVGESRATLQQLSGEIGQGFEEGTEEDPVPANLREVHKHYFGDLKKKIDAKSAQPVAPTAAKTPGSTAAEGTLPPK